MQTTRVGIRGLKPWGSPAQMSRAVLGRQVDWARTSDYFVAGKQIVKTNGAATAGANAITVRPTPRDLRVGEKVDFGLNGAGAANVVELTADAPEGAVVLQVTDLRDNLVDNQEGFIQAVGIRSGDKFIPEGTVMSLDATSQKIFPRRDANGTTEPAIGLIVSDASNSRYNPGDSRSGYGLVLGNTDLFENLLPDADSSGNLSATYKTELNANTFGFTYRKYSDSRV
jgi:hypothetical protein